MTTLLDRAMEAVRGLSAEMQDEVARLVLRIADGEEAPIALMAEERAAIAGSRAAAARGEFATEDEVRAVWAKHSPVESKLSSRGNAKRSRDEGQRGLLWIAASP